MKGGIKGPSIFSSVDATFSIYHQSLIQCSVSGVPVRALLDTESTKSLLITLGHNALGVLAQTPTSFA